MSKNQLIQQIKASLLESGTSLWKALKEIFQTVTVRLGFSEINVGSLKFRFGITKPKASSKKSDSQTSSPETARAFSLKRLGLVLIIVGLILVALFGAPQISSAEESVYEETCAEVIYHGKGSFSTTELFPSFSRVMPGDTLCQTITLKNDSPSGAVAFYATSFLPGNSTFLSRLSLEVYVGNECISWGNEGSQSVFLGEVPQGEKLEARAILQVPAELGNEFQLTRGTVDWLISVEEITEAGESGVVIEDGAEVGSQVEAKDISTLPKTADTVMLVLWSALFAISFVILLVMRIRSHY